MPARHIPGVLESDIRIDIPGTDSRPGACPVPEARIELQLQLRVGAIAQLGNGRLLESIEACLHVVQRAQYTEWQGQDHPVKGSCFRPAGCSEGQGITSVFVGGNSGHAPVEIDGTGGQTGCNRRGQLLVPTDDMVALIGASKDAEIAGLRLKAEQIHQVERTL